MFEHRYAAAFAITALLAGCTSDHIVGRYAKITCKPDGVTEVPCEGVPTAAASVVSIASASPTASPSGVVSLSDRGQAAYIERLALLSKNADALRAAMAQGLDTKDSVDVQDRTVFHRTFIISLRKTGDFNPVDRIEAADIIIRPTDAKFTSWDTLTSAYSTVNAGTVQLAQARGLTESVTAGVPSTAGLTGIPLTASGTFGGSQTDTRTENFSATAQIENLSAAISPDGTLIIHRQGGLGLDLTGNIIIKADLAYAAGPDYGYGFSVKAYIDGGKVIAPGKLETKITPTMSTPPEQPLQATVDMNYTVRHVTNGGNTYEEIDDTVVEVTQKAAAVTVNLISGHDASPHAFGLYVVDRKNPLDTQGLNVQARALLQPVTVCFASYNAAVDFLAYLKTNNRVTPDKLGKDKLGLGFVLPVQPFIHLTKTYLDLLQVEPGCPVSMVSGQ